jgi:hypothetical protein
MYYFQISLVVAFLSISYLLFFALVYWCFINVYKAINRDLIERHKKIKKIREK